MADEKARLENRGTRQENNPRTGRQLITDQDPRGHLAPAWVPSEKGRTDTQRCGERWPVRRQIKRQMTEVNNSLASTFV